MLYLHQVGVLFVVMPTLTTYRAFPKDTLHSDTALSMGAVLLY